MRHAAGPLLTPQPRRIPSRVDWRIGHPDGEVDFSSRVALRTIVELSLAPDLDVPQTRLLPLRIRGGNPGPLMVSLSGVSTPVSKDGTFTLRGGGGNRRGAWREMIVGRIEGRRIMISIYQCHMVLDRPGQDAVVCKVNFRGISWATF
jgi:hypothetical protein